MIVGSDIFYVTLILDNIFIFILGIKYMIKERNARDNKLIKIFFALFSILTTSFSIILWMDLITKF